VNGWQIENDKQLAPGAVLIEGGSNRYTAAAIRGVKEEWAKNADYLMCQSISPARRTVPNLMNVQVYLCAVVFCTYLN
jgi:hypothetical protein